MQISLTTFLSFAIANGPSKLTVVRQAKAQYAADYLPSSDYYRYLRDGIVDMHKRNLTKSSLDDAITLAHNSRHENYRALIAGYRKWLGRKNIQWCDPVGAVWSAAGLDVRLNPELRLAINGRRYVVKLYLKADKPSKHLLDSALFLLQSEVGDPYGATAAIVDVRRGKQFDATPPRAGMDVYLRMEAQAFLTVWKST